MNEEWLKGILTILGGMLSDPLSDENTYEDTYPRHCKWCSGEESGYYDYRSFEHRANCPWLLHQQLCQQFEQSGHES